MSPESQSLFDAALTLPEAERSLLVQRLTESLPPDADDLADEELFTELERRRIEVEEGQVRPIPWAEFRLEE
jgi:putative addiction module component (TIGR02574 family)